MSIKFREHFLANSLDKGRNGYEIQSFVQVCGRMSYRGVFCGILQTPGTFPPGYILTDYSTVREIPVRQWNSIIERPGIKPLQQAGKELQARLNLRKTPRLLPQGTPRKRTSKMSSGRGNKFEADRTGFTALSLIRAI